MERYLTSFLDTKSIYAYFAHLAKLKKAGNVVQDFLSRVQRHTGRRPRWLVSDNADEYMKDMVGDALADMGITDIPAIPYSSEDNGIAERFNHTIMNEVRTALIVANMSWEYWIWALHDVVEKYNQLPHSVTGCSSHEAWPGDHKPDLQHLYIFGKVAFTPVMNKATRAGKQNDRGRIVRYLARYSDTRIITKTTDGTVKRYRGSDFNPYFTSRDPVVAMRNT